jgi:Ca-activated chloride channel family protein
MKELALSFVLPLVFGALAGLATGASGRPGPAFGGLVVTVTDANGDVTGATVTISNTNGLVTPGSVESDRHGQARFTELRPGAGYRIEVALDGYGTQVVEDITIAKGDPLRISVVLTPVLREAGEGSRVQHGRPIADPTPEVEERLSVANPAAPASGSESQKVRGFDAKHRLERRDADGGGKLFVYGDRDHAHRQKLKYSRFNTEAYDEIRENGFRPAFGAPLSTFSIDVDTASYSNVRRFLDRGVLPPPGAVRIEELVNYFNYDYVEPDGEVPFGIDVEVGEAPWDPRNRLARIGLKGRELQARHRPPCNLVFLIDVSGSMNPANKLPLVRRSMKMLVDELNHRDQVSIVVYAGAAGLVLPPTEASDRATIREAIDSLQAGGSTAGGAGIELAYRQARRSFIEGGVNRVVLATDGDFNVGISDRSSLIRLIEKEARTGVFLTALGFGMGNLKDSRLEQLADHGNGNYAYIDSIREARKVLVEEAGSTLVAIAKDVKIQVEFNPAEVAAYRLIGYENRALRDEDFNDDTRDAGEIGAGHTVTALYEIVPQGLRHPAPAIDPLKYQQPRDEDPGAKIRPGNVLTEAAGTGELMTVKIRWKEPDGNRSRLQELAVVDRGRGLSAASEDFRFAAAVAGFGMLLRDSDHSGDLTFDDVMALAENGMGRDRHGHRSGFLELVNRAGSLKRYASRR